MAQKASFSDGDWKKVKQAPMLAGGTVTALDFGLVSVVKEASAIIKVMTEAKNRYPSNELIHAVCDEADANEQNTVPDSEKFSADVALRLIGEAVSIVQRVATPRESKEYCELIYAVAEGAANAAGGGFFGGGDKVSSDESAYLAKLKSQLGM